MFEMSLQLRVGVFVVTGLVIIFAIFGTLGWSMLRQSGQRVMDKRLLIAQLLASYLDSELEEQFELLDRSGPLIATSIENRSAQDVASSVLLHQEPFVSSVFLVDPSGNIRWSEPSSQTLLDAETVAALTTGQAFAAGNRYLSGVRRMDLTGQPFVAIAVPGRDRDRVHIGTVGALIDVNHLTFRRLVVAAQELGKTGHAELLDENGVVIASSDPNRVLEPGAHRDFYRPLLVQRAASTAITQPITDGDPAERGQRHAMVFAPLRAVPWGLTLGGSEGELYVAADRWRWQVATFGGLALVAALCLVWITTRSVARSVRALTLASQRMGAGDLTTPVPDLGGGEVHTLAEALDEMRGHLQGALDALAMEKSRYQGIIGSMTDAVFTTDCNHNVTAFNPAAEVLTGWRSEDVVGRPCNEIFQSLGACGLEACSSMCTWQPERPLDPIWGVTREVIRGRDGCRLPLAHARSAVRDLDGALVGVVHVLRDVSAEEEVERLKDMFLSMVSHELRTPLGHIKGYATTLLLPDGPTDEETRQRCLRVIVGACDELGELVDNLLDMSSIGAGAFSIDPQPLRPGLLIRRAVDRARLNRSGHRLDVRMQARLPVVLADGRRVEQVIHNLLDNAIKYSPGGGRVVVSARAEVDEVLVSVSDEGIGVPADELGELFEPFQRGTGARARRIGGRGLGLAICKGIVEAHRGRIWAESPAQFRSKRSLPGTVVRFTLPTLEKVPTGRSNATSVNGLLQTNYVRELDSC